MFNFKDIFVYFYVIKSFSAMLFQRCCIIYEIQQTCQCDVQILVGDYSLVFFLQT